MSFQVRVGSLFLVLFMACGPGLKSRIDVATDGGEVTVGPETELKPETVAAQCEHPKLVCERRCLSADEAATLCVPEWKMISVETQPDWNRDQSLVYDAERKTVYLYVGNLFYSWNGDAWKRISTSLGPKNFSYSRMVFDAKRRTVLFLGSTDSFTDTWEWNGTSWIRRSGAGGPPPRKEFGLAYDSARNRTVLYGGQDSIDRYLFDTWEWDGTKWTDMKPEEFPEDLATSTLAYDDLSKSVLLLGGYSPRASKYRDNVWAWNGTAWKKLQVELSTGPRIHAAMVFDSTRQKMVLFGGYLYLNTYTYLSDLWEWDGKNWLQLMPTSSPPPAQLSLLVYDENRKKLVMMGGENLNNHFREVWELSFP